MWEAKISILGAHMATRVFVDILAPGTLTQNRCSIDSTLRVWWQQKNTQKNRSIQSDSGNWMIYKMSVNDLR